MVNKLLLLIISQGYFRFTPRWGLASIGHYLRCRGRVVLSPEGVFILGGRSCPRRAERSRDLGKMLVASGGIALRRLIDPPGLKMPSGDGNSLQIQVDPPAPKLTAGATGSAGGAGVASSGSTWAFLSGAQQSSYQAAK